MPRFYTATSNDALTGAAPIVKTGAGTLWLTSPSNNTFTGDITVGVDGGTLRIGGNTFYAAGTGRTGTTLPAMGATNTVTVQRGGIFYIQDNQGAPNGYIANRLGSEGARPALTLEGGSFTVNGPNTAGLQTTQSVGQVTLASGASVITVTRNNNTATPKLIGGSLAVTPGAYAQFAGTTLGASALNASQIYFTTPPSTVGGGGAFGSPTVSIVPATRIGNDFVAYGLYGIRNLATSEYTATADINAAGSTDNVKFTTGTLAALAGDKTVNSLAVLGGTSPWKMGTGNILTLTSGQLLSTPTLRIEEGAVTAGAGSDTDLDIVPTGGTLTMAANLVDNGGGKVKLVKSGGGTLTMSQTSDNTYSGGTVVNEGTLSMSTVADRRYLGTGPVKGDNAILNISSIGATANSAGDDYTAVNAAQINLANLAYTGADTFNIESGSVIAGSSATANQGLNSLSRGYNVTLADGAVIGQNTALSAPLNLGTGTIKDLGAGADLYYGLNNNQNNVNGSVTVGSGTPFKGISTDRSARAWQQGTIDVAAGTTDFALQGLPIPGATPYTLTLGNGLTAGAPVINLNGSGTVDAHVYGYVTLDDDQALYGDTTAGEVVDFTVESGTYLTANREGAMGTGTGVATATVKHGGTMTTVGSIANNPWAALGGDVTVEGGGRLIVNTPLGLTGAGALTFKTGSILDIQAGDGFSGPQAAAATVEPGTIVRLTTNPGSASDPLDNYLGGASPVYELYNGNRSAANPLAVGTTVMTLNRDANGVGGMLVNDGVSRTYGTAPNGVIAIGTNGGVIAATRFTTLTVSQPIALDTNELIIGSTETFDWVSEPKLGTVLLNASIGANTADNGSRITVLPGAELRNGANALPDLTEVSVGGGFYLAGADTIGALSGTGLVTVANALTVGRNDEDATFSGVLAGASGLYKTGAGRLDLTGDKSTFTGTVRVNGGELALSGGGKLLNTGNTAFTLVENGVLHLDNSEVNLTDRLTGAAPGVTFNGGTLRFTGKDGEPSSETITRADFALNASTIEVINGSGAGSSSELIFSTIASATPVGSLNLTAQNGTLGLAGDNPRVKFTSGLTAGLVGFATVDGAPAYYDTTLGFRAYTLAESTEFDGTVNQSALVGTVFTSANLQPTLTASRTVNSIWIDSPGAGKFIDLSTSANNSLTLAKGRLHLTGPDDFEIKRTAGTGTLGGTPTYIYLYIDEPGTTLTLSAPTAKAIQKGGAGALLLNATHTGSPLVINDGLVKYGATGDLGAIALTTWNDGLLDLAGKSDTLGALTLYAGGITNSVESVASTLTIGALTMGSGPAGSSAFVDMGTNGTLKLGGTVTYNTVNDPNTAYIRGKQIDLNVASGSYRQVTVNDSVAPSAYIDLDIPASIGSVNSNVELRKTGGGTLRLSGANTFDGPLTISGTLRLAHPQAQGQPSTTRTLKVNSSSSLVLDNANGNIDVFGNYALNLNGGGNTAIGPVSGAIVNWSGNNSLSGATTLAAATTLASFDGTLTLAGDISGNYDLTVQGDGDMVLAGARGGTGKLNKNGAGTLTLTGASSFTGATTLYAGVMNVRNNTALGTAAGGVSTYIGSELQLENDITIGAEALTLRGTGLSNGGALRNLSGTNTWGGAVTLGMTDVRINADAGKLILDVASGNGIAGNTFNVLFGGEGDIEVADPIATTTGMLTKDGGGTLILGGVNTYTGATTVDDGALRVNGSIHATSPVTVEDGATLEGTGTCLGTVTVRSGATVAPGLPGTAGGTLTIATLNLEAGSVCAFECTAAPANDKLVVSGSGKLTIAAGTGVALHAAGTTNAWAVLGTNSLIQYTGTLNGGVENLAVVNPDSDVLYTFFTEDNWIKVKIESAKVSALAATELTPSGGKLNGHVVDVAAETPSVWFCWDRSDKGTAATSAWAHVEYVGEYAKGQSFSKVLTGLLSASNYTYRVYAENSAGPAWSPEAISFKPVYLPAVVNTGARGVGPGVALLQGEVTDTGSEAPNVWFLYWKDGESTTNVVDDGIQAAACSTEVSGLPQGASYGYMLMASNQAGVVYSAPSTFTVSSTYYVALGGDDANDGLSWETALQNIPTAVGKTQDGDLIIVGDGTHGLASQLTIDKGITLQSLNGRDAAAIGYTNGVNAYSFRLLYINHPYAEVSGFTVTNGRSTAGLGGGVAIDTLGGTLRECRITRCEVSWGKKAAALYQVAGLVTRCIIEDNPTYNGNHSSVGTCYMTGGLMENCLIRNNVTHLDGAGLYMTAGTARNCTIVGNSSSSDSVDAASSTGNSVYLMGTAVLKNCIVWNNIVRNYPTRATRNIFVKTGTSPTIVNCAVPQAIGTGTVTNDPAFVDYANGDCRLRAASPCINTGVTSGDDGAYDLDGGARIIGDNIIGENIDIGCYEYDTAPFSCGFAAAPADGMEPLAVTFTPRAFGTATDPSLLEYVWTIDDGCGAPILVPGTNLQAVARTLPAGRYTVTLAVTDPAGPATVSDTVTNVVRVSPATIYVAAGNAGACAPYTNWVTAAANIPEALELAADGATIIVSNGTYAISRTPILAEAITMQSVNGWSSTIIQAPGIAYVQGLLLFHPGAVVDGFTLTGGRTGLGSDGGGVYIGAPGGTLLNSRVTANRTHYYASGAGIFMAAGRVDRCLVDNNSINMDSIHGQGIEMLNGIVENSLIINNRTYTMKQHGGGGGGVCLHNNAVLRNCTVVGNSCAYAGGVNRSNPAIVQNCIIVGNESIYDTSRGAPNWGGDSATAWQNVCTPVNVGTGCITTDPEFVDAVEGDYRLLPESFCIAGGLAIPGLGALDYAGNARVSGVAVDVGAYEYDASGTSIGIATTPQEALLSAEVAIAARVYGFDTATNLLDYTWVLDDGAGTPVYSGTGLANLQRTYNVPGYYNIRLTVHDPVSETTLVAVRTNAVYIAPETIYVVQENSQAQAPYDTWAKAATNIHHATDGAIGGVTVLVSNGTYAVTKQIRLSEAVTLRGVNGYGVTRLQGNKVDGVRILNLSHADALVAGLTISGGKAAWNDYGSGVLIQEKGGTVQECWITGNETNTHLTGCGVYMFGGKVTRCLITDNGSGVVTDTIPDVDGEGWLSNFTGGGVRQDGGWLEYSVIRDNAAYKGGGVHITGGTMLNCTITENYAALDGSGGILRDGGDIYNTIIWDNEAYTNEIADTGCPNWMGASSSYQNCCAPITVGVNCQTNSPNFRNVSADDYRLRVPSSCIDKGLYESDWVLGQLDFLGKPRNDARGRTDIGAIENQSGRAIRLILR